MHKKISAHLTHAAPHGGRFIVGINEGGEYLQKYSW